MPTLSNRAIARATLVALSALAVFAARGRATTFADPGARVFTLAPGGSISALVVLPNGDAVYAVRGRHDYRGDVPGRLMRLTADGALHQVRAEGAAVLAAESSSTVLRVPEPDFEGPSVHTVERRVPAVNQRRLELAVLERLEPAARKDPLDWVPTVGLASCDGALCGLAVELFGTASTRAQRHVLARVLFRLATRDEIDVAEFAPNRSKGQLGPRLDRGQAELRLIGVGSESLKPDSHRELGVRIPLAGANRLDWRAAPWRIWRAKPGRDHGSGCTLAHARVPRRPSRGARSPA
jgi:hypothetical protein